MKINLKAISATIFSVAYVFAAVILGDAAVAVMLALPSIITCLGLIYFTFCLWFESFR